MVGLVLRDELRMALCVEHGHYALQADVADALDGGVRADQAVLVVGVFGHVFNGDPTLVSVGLCEHTTGLAFEAVGLAPAGQFLVAASCADNLVTRASLFGDLALKLFCNGRG